MKKLVIFKKTRFIISIVIMLCACGSISPADGNTELESEKSEKELLNEAEKKFETMNATELNEYISDVLNGQSQH